MESVADPRLDRVVETYFQGLGAQAADSWLALFSENAISHDPVGAPPAEGKRAISLQWEVLRSQFESLRFKIDHVSYGGSSNAAVKWTCRAVGSNNRTVGFEGIHVFELGTDGTINTVMAYWDPAAAILDVAGETGSA